MKSAKQPLGICLFVLILSILAAGGAFAAEPQTLKLSDYLAQVTEKHTGYKSADQTAKGARMYAEEGRLLMRPSLLGNASRSALGQTNPFSSEGRFNMTSYSLGLTQQTPVGLSSKLTYNYVDLAIAGQASFDTGYVQLELSQSLLRNWNGREVRSQAEMQESAALAKSFGQTFATKQVLMEAEAAYWNLALARELVKVRQEGVDRAEKISGWAGRRVRLQLADRAEGLQSTGNLQFRKLELRQAQDQLRAAAQAFNSSRGSNAADVPETLELLTPELIVKMEAPARTLIRDDVKATEFQARAAVAQALIGRERNKPTLELFASTPLTEPAAPTGAAASAIPPTSWPSTTVGVRLSAPLDFSTSSRAREGYAAEASAAEYTLQRKIFEEERDWVDLAAKFTQAKERLKLYAELEQTQKDKLAAERTRQQRGRSTLQQVLFYETDYSQAQLGRITTLAEIMALNAQMKLYGVSYESR